MKGNVIKYRRYCSRRQFLDVEVPWNMLTINDDTEAAVCLEKIKKQTENLKKKS